MARGQFLSILGLYQYNHSVFDNLVIPDTIDRDVLIANICMECAELELVYPDWSVMREAIGYWSRKRIHSWEKISTVLYEKYDPFINIKRDEVRTIKHTSKGDNTTFTNAFDSGTGTERDRINSDFINETEEHFHVEGDSAITDAQDVAQKEVKLRVEHDLYNIIINDFRDRFCLLIY